MAKADAEPQGAGGPHRAGHRPALPLPGRQPLDPLPLGRDPDLLQGRGRPALGQHGLLHLPVAAAPADGGRVRDRHLRRPGAGGPGGRRRGPQPGLPRRRHRRVRGRHQPGRPEQRRPRGVRPAQRGLRRQRLRRVDDRLPEPDVAGAERPQPGRPEDRQHPDRDDAGHGAARLGPAHHLGLGHRPADPGARGDQPGHLHDRGARRAGLDAGRAPAAVPVPAGPQAVLAARAARGGVRWRRLLRAQARVRLLGEPLGRHRGPAPVAGLGDAAAGLARLLRPADPLRRRPQRGPGPPPPGRADLSRPPERCQRRPGPMLQGRRSRHTGRPGRRRHS